MTSSAPPGNHTDGGSAGPRRTIAMVAACPFPSHQGTQVFIRHLANALAHAGHAIHLLTYDESEPLQLELDARIAWHRAPTPRVGLRSGPSRARVRADAVLLRTTIQVLRSHAIDVLHVHNVEGLAIGAVASRLTGVPLVYHAHTSLSSELPLYTTTTFGRWAAKLCGKGFDQLLPKTAKAVICFDSEQAARLQRQGVAASRLHVVPLGLAMDELTGSVNPAGKQIIYAGNPDPYQNLDLLRAAFAKVRAADPEVTLRLISNHEAQAFGALAADAGVEHRTFTSPAELSALMRTGNVGIVTRTLEVGAPVKALSYLSAGLPVVACETGAAGLLRAFPDACSLVDATPEALAEAMLKALDQRPTLGIAKARRAFEITDQIVAYEAVYTTVA